MNNIVYKAKKKLNENGIDESLAVYLYKYLADSSKYEEKINELIKGIPVQYLIGNVDFLGYKINVNKSVLIPRFETEELVDKTINYINRYFNKQIRIADLGTGSGCIAISLNKRLNAIVDATDISSDALNIARQNAKDNNANINFYEGDFLKPLTEKYDVIISNPPYIGYNEKIMDIVKNNEPRIALYADNNGLLCYQMIFKDISKYLKEKYLIALEIGYKQSEDIKKTINQNLNNVNIVVEKDMQGKERFIFVTNI